MAHEGIAKLWKALDTLIDHFDVLEDPIAGGPAVIAATQSRIMKSWGRLTRIAGFVYKHHANLTRKVVGAKRLRGIESATLMENAINDPGLRAVRDQATKLKARIGLRLTEHDESIADIEADLHELDMLRKFVQDTIDRAKGAKEVMRVQAELLLRSRAVEAGGDWEEQN